MGAAGTNQFVEFINGWVCRLQQVQASGNRLVSDSNLLGERWY